MKPYKITRFFILMTGLLLSFFLSSCSDQTESPKVNAKTQMKTELVFANFRDIRDLNPHLYSGEMWAQNMLYEPLIILDQDGTFKPWLAESWEISEDGKVYTFHLRQDVTFSDGEKFNAHSAKQNIDAIVANKERHTWLEMVRLIQSVQTLDEYTLRLTLLNAYYPMLTELSVVRPFRFVSPKAFKNGQTKDGVTAYIGTGPWVLAQHKTDEYAVFTANPNYWGKKPKLNKITMKVIPDNQTRIMALQKGEIDLVYGRNMIDADSMERFSQDNAYTVQLSDPTSTRMILMNTTKGALKDVAVRQALEHAVNKQAISEGIFKGSEKPAQTLFSKTVPYCNIDLKTYDYNLNKSVALLENAGWKTVGNQKFRLKDAKVLKIHLFYNNNSVLEKTISEYLQSEFQKIGVDLVISGEEEQAYRDRQKMGDFDMVFNISWGSPYDPQSSIAGMKLPVYGDYAAQQGLKEKKALDQAITDVLISTDEQKRQQLYTNILTILHDEAVYIPLTYERNRAVHHADLKGVTFNYSQYEIPFERMYFNP